MEDDFHPLSHPHRAHYCRIAPPSEMPAAEQFRAGNAALLETRQRPPIHVTAGMIRSGRHLAVIAAAATRPRPPINCNRAAATYFHPARRSPVSAAPWPGQTVDLLLIFRSVLLPVGTALPLQTEMDVGESACRYQGLGRAMTARRKPWQQRT